MMRVKWCRECGRLSAFNFAYCPWCGKEFEEKPDGKAIIDCAFGRLEQNLKTAPADRLERLERQMTELERDLEDFIERAQEGDGNGHEAISIPDHLPRGHRGDPLLGDFPVR